MQTRDTVISLLLPAVLLVLGRRRRRWANEIKRAPETDKLHYRSGEANKGWGTNRFNSR